MKCITILSLLLLTSPAFAELTKADLRAVIQEEIAASEKRTREYIDLKIDAVNARIGDLQLLQIALIGLIAAAVAIPQIVIAYKERDWKEIRAEIQQLREKVEALQNASS
jgi:cell division protein FtsL